MIYLDTNVIIYALENHEKYGPSCKRILKDIQSGKLMAFASILVLVELLNFLVRERRTNPAFRTVDLPALVATVEQLPIQWSELSPVLIRRAAAYTHPINGADYIHLATMEQFSIDAIISADADFDRARVRRIDPLHYGRSVVG